MDLNDDGDDDVDEDENDNDPVSDEEAARESGPPRVPADHVHDDEPVVQHHLLEQHDHRRGIVVEVQRVVKVVPWRDDLVVNFHGHLAAEEKDAKLCELVDHEVEKEELCEDRLGNHPCALD